MDLLKTLKQFKNIEPDKNFTRKSRGLILRGGESLPSRFARIFTSGLQIGASVALAGLLVFAILSGASYIKPLEITAIDPGSIRAEAEAIDIQIQLSSFSYSEPAVSESTPSSAAPKKSAVATQAPNEEDSPISIEEALILLSE